MAGRAAISSPSRAGAVFGSEINSDPKSVVEGKRVDLGGRRIIKKKKKSESRLVAESVQQFITSEFPNRLCSTQGSSAVTVSYLPLTGLGSRLTAASYCSSCQCAVA